MGTDAKQENIRLAAALERINRAWVTDDLIDLAKRTSGPWDEAVDRYIRALR